MKHLFTAVLVATLLTMPVADLKTASKHVRPPMPLAFDNPVPIDDDCDTEPWWTLCTKYGVCIAPCN